MRIADPQDRLDKKFYQPCMTIEEWIVVIYERPSKFPMDAAQRMIQSLMEACALFGVLCSFGD